DFSASFEDEDRFVFRIVPCKPTRSETLPGTETRGSVFGLPDKIVLKPRRAGCHPRRRNSSGPHWQRNRPRQIIFVVEVSWFCVDELYCNECPNAHRKR